MGHCKSILDTPFVSFFMLFEMRCHTIGVDLKLSTYAYQPLLGVGGEALSYDKKYFYNNGTPYL